MVWPCGWVLLLVAIPCGRQGPALGALSMDPPGEDDTGRWRRAPRMWWQTGADEEAQAVPSGGGEVMEEGEEREAPSQSGVNPEGDGPPAVCLSPAAVSREVPEPGLPEEESLGSPPSSQLPYLPSPQLPLSSVDVVVAEGVSATPGKRGGESGGARTG